MDFHDFQWGECKIAYWDMQSIDITKPISTQLSELKEDLAQVRYKNNVIFDIGWYPEFSSEGQFVLIAIENEDWENPIFKRTTKFLPELRQIINEWIWLEREKSKV